MLGRVLLHYIAAAEDMRPVGRDALQMVVGAQQCVESGRLPQVKGQLLELVLGQLQENKAWQLEEKLGQPLQGVFTEVEFGEGVAGPDIAAGVIHDHVQFW